MKKQTDLSKNLEQLENEIWGEPGYPSYLVTTIHSLRKKPLKDYTIEDLRISIGQNCSLKYLIPIALERLKENIWAEGHFYKGDLLNNVLNADPEFWKKNRILWSSFNTLLNDQRHLFDKKEDRGFLKMFQQFQAIHNAG